MMDLGDSSVCEECAMICTDIYSDEDYEEMIVYGDQGTSTRKYDLTKKRSLIMMWPYAHKTVCHSRKNEDG